MSIILASFTAFVVANAPSWLASLRGTVLGKGQEYAADKGKELVVGGGKHLAKRLFHLDEKEQLRHLEQALKNATERGLATFHTLQERDLYKDILQTLSQPGPSGDTLRHEVMQFFTLEENPDLARLNDIYNRRQRLHAANHQDIEVAPYLSSFFSALIGELYADPYFRPQLSDVLQQRAHASMQRSLLDIVSVLKNIDTRLDNNYSAADFARDVEVYTTHIERTQRNLKIIGIVPKDQNSDPEIGGIFVPLRIAFDDQRMASDQSSFSFDNQRMVNYQFTFPFSDQRMASDQSSFSFDDYKMASDQSPNSIVAALEQSPCLVLLGGPGSGKSTATKYLAWSHAATNQSSAIVASTSLLSGNPLPLRIELRRLNEERKRANYDFLSFATDVLLKREGITINPQMFKELLTRRCLLLLFDGLDEVTTLKERLELVNEIEHFALSYPGNRVLVTSRPVGYDLSRVSHPLFTHATVQDFNDQQIQQFLHNWYTAVLRLSPIPQREQEELDLLLMTLKGNPRLHKLAENPLLLTVIIQLHRYERLPDRRVLVYSRCADLLLETWSKLRGTDTRWKDMKMVKEDQSACVAYLGFVLHERSQEEQSTNSKKVEEMAVDVSSRFLYNCVEEFLKKRELIIGVAEQRKEARRFIELVQEEAGLIVERGTGEDSERLYGFVHRTFQEYFAAADVYERYQQEDNSASIISDFLRERLHDPHWREVILLLLGKLKSKPATKQLKDILEGKTQTLRSRYTDIVQQDLFFVCDCLIEEINVENSLVDLVVLRLCDVVREGWFPSQKQVALEYLGKLMKGRQCMGRGKKELIGFAKSSDTLDATIVFYAIDALCFYLPVEAEERQLLEQILTRLVDIPDLLGERVREMVDILYVKNPKGSDARRLAITVLMKLVERAALSVEQILEMAEYLRDKFLDVRDAGQSELWTLIVETLAGLLERTALSAEQIRKIVGYSSIAETEARQLVTRNLRELLERTDLSVEQTWETAVLLHRRSANGSEDQQLAQTILMKLVNREDLSVEQTLEMVEYLNGRILPGEEFEKSEYWPLIVKMSVKLLERTDLSVEQIWETAKYSYAGGSEAHQRATKNLRKLLDRTNLSVEQIQATAESLYDLSDRESETKQLAQMTLKRLLERLDLSVEQIWEVAMSLYHRSDGESETKQLAQMTLKRLLERSDLSVKQIGETVGSLYHESDEGSETKQLAQTMLRILAERRDLSVEQPREFAWFLSHYEFEGLDNKQQAVKILMKLLERSDLLIGQMLEIVSFFFSESVFGYFENEELEIVGMRTLIGMLERTDLSVGQIWTLAELAYNWSLEGSDERLFATSTMLTLLSQAGESESKNDVYRMLRSMVPQFHKLALVEGHS